MKKIIFLIGLLFSHVLWASASDDLIQILMKTHTIVSQFKQTVFNGDGEVINQSSGNVWLSKPNRFHWSVDKPMQQVVICDGKTVWNYEPDLEQVTINTMKAGIQSMPLAILNGDPQALVNNFTITRHNSDYFLVAKTKNNFTKIVLSIHGNVIQQMLLYDNLGQQTRVEFSGTKLNQAVNPQLFTFSIPKGVDVIRNAP